MQVVGLISKSSSLTWLVVMLAVDWDLSWNCWPEREHMTPLYCLESLKAWQLGSKGKYPREKEPDESSITSYNLVLEVIWLHFCYILLVYIAIEVRLASGGGNIDFTSQ